MGLEEWFEGAQNGVAGEKWFLLRTELEHVDRWARG